MELVLGRFQPTGDQRLSSIGRLDDKELD